MVRRLKQFGQTTDISVDWVATSQLCNMTMNLPSVCSPPHPHDTDGFNFELNSFGLYPDAAPLLLIIQRDRVKGRVVAEFGEHNTGLARGSARTEDAVAVLNRTAVPTARASDFSISTDFWLWKEGLMSTDLRLVSTNVLDRDYWKHVWKDTMTSSNYALWTGIGLNCV